MLGCQDKGTDAEQLRRLICTKRDNRLSMWAIHTLATCTNKTNNHSCTIAAYIMLQRFMSSLHQERHEYTQIQHALKAR